MAMGNNYCSSYNYYSLRRIVHAVAVELKIISGLKSGG